MANLTFATQRSSGDVEIDQRDRLNGAAAFGKRVTGSWLAAARRAAIVGITRKDTLMFGYRAGSKTIDGHDQAGGKA